MSNEGTSARKPEPFKTIVFGGFAVGVLDFLDATIFFGLYAGAPFQRIWQGVAAGLLGREASREGGWKTAALGIFLHFVVAFGVATVYYFAARSFPVLIRHPVISGLVYGVLANFVMQYVVIPLSAIGATSAFSLWPFVNSVVGHALLVGLPVALIAAWSAKRGPDSFS
jgi:hypothetical protein